MGSLEGEAEESGLESRTAIILVKTKPPTIIGGFVFFGR